MELTDAASSSLFAKQSSAQENFGDSKQDRPKAGTTPSGNRAGHPRRETSRQSPLLLRGLRYKPICPATKKALGGG